MDFQPVKFGLGTVWSLTMRGRAQDLVRDSVISGNIYKQSGHFSKGWEKRFFVLAPVMLMLYFDSQEDTDPRGIVVLTKESAIQSELSGMAGRDHVLTVRVNPTHSDTKTLHIAVDTAEEARDWCEAFYTNRLDVLRDAAKTVTGLTEAAALAAATAKTEREALLAEIAELKREIATLKNSAKAADVQSAAITATLKQVADTMRTKATKTINEASLNESYRPNPLAINNIREAIGRAESAARAYSDVKHTIAADIDPASAWVAGLNDTISDITASVNSLADSCEFLCASHSDLRTRFNEVAIATKKLAATREVELEQARMREAVWKKEESGLRERLQQAQNLLQDEKNKAMTLANQVHSLQGKLSAMERKAADAEAKAFSALASQQARHAGGDMPTSTPSVDTKASATTVVSTPMNAESAKPQLISPTETAASTSRRPSFLKPGASPSVADTDATSGMSAAGGTGGADSGKVFVFIMGARKLGDAAFGTFGGRSAYCRLRLGDQPERISPAIEAVDRGKDKGLCAAFHYVNAFRVASVSSDDTQIRVDIFAHRSLQKDVRIGTAYIACKALSQHPNQPHAVWLILHPDEHCRPDRAEVLVPVKPTGLATFPSNAPMGVEHVVGPMLPPPPENLYVSAELPPPPAHDGPAVLAQVVFVNQPSQRPAFHLPVTTIEPSMLPSVPAALVEHRRSFASVTPTSDAASNRKDANSADVVKLRNNLETLARAYRELQKERERTETETKQLREQNEQMQILLAKFFKQQQRLKGLKAAEAGPA